MSILNKPRKLIPFLLGLTIFLVVVLIPSAPDAIDPDGTVIPLTHNGKTALGLFLLASIWWIFEVFPVGVTGITVGVVQALWLIRDPRTAMTDFMDPSVWFIFGSLLTGAAFAKTGLTRRMAFLMLTRIPEKTNAIYLGIFSMTAVLTMFMAHTAVAAALFPMLLIVQHVYEPTNKKTRFGKGLFIGMAWTAGAGSIITLLGAARGAVAIGFFQELTGRNVTFFQLTKYMMPMGLLMVFLLWIYICLVFPPEKATLPGLRKKATRLYEQLGSISASEIGTIVIVLLIISTLALRSFIPGLDQIDKSAIVLVGALLFFLTGILDLKDLEAVPWNIILLFGGAMSIGFCLWQTGAAEWLATGWLSKIQDAPWLMFVMGVTVFVLLMTNFIMNVAAIAVTLPVALVMASHAGVAPEMVMFASLAAAGMPLMLLVGAAPNAIAHESHQFTSREFLLAGIPASGILLLVIALFVWKIWPWMGMPVFQS